MKIIGTIERNDNNYYQISSENEMMGHCFGGYGYSVAEAKADFFKSIEVAREMIAESEGVVPEEFLNNEVEFFYDLPSFFDNFDWINITAFAKKVGINESKMRAYKSGLSNASERTINKILSSVHSLGAELCATSL